MGKRREPPPEEGAPLWMCTFGDLMSLLLCFFIMLFAISIIAEPRFQAVADTLNQDFTGYPGSSRTTTRNTKTTTTITESAARSQRIAALTGGQPTPGPQGASTEVHTILLDGETIKVITFELDSDELTEQAKWDLRSILPVLQGSPRKIMVKGYSLPTEGGERFQRSTDLAFFRAVETVDHLVSLGLEQDFFEVVVEPGTTPRRTSLPAGTVPEHAGASVEVLLLNQTLRSVRE